MIRPTKDSEIKFALWLPPTSAWNGRYRQEGNGGWAGSIRYSAMIDPLRRGYATASTDDGHEGGAGAAWAVGHPEKLVDFGHRAVHELAVHAKGILEAHYGKQPSRNYFFGCSDGGREALMEAQRYPEDFDGLIVSAPANRWSQLFTAFVWNELAQMKTPGSAIPPGKLPAVQQAVHAACDLRDGVKDGLIEDPRACSFNPETLACKGEDDNLSCLTRPQLDALKAIYAGPRNPRTGEQIVSGVPSGTEAVTWPNWIASADPMKTIQATLGNPYYGHAVFENPTWDVRSMDFDKDFLYGEQKAAPVLNSASPDLRSFRANGGKIIHYHGWGDAAITGYASIEYDEAVKGFMAKYPDSRAQAPGQTEDFYRLFMVPGLGTARAARAESIRQRRRGPGRDDERSRARCLRRARSLGGEGDGPAAADWRGCGRGRPEPADDEAHLPVPEGGAVQGLGRHQRRRQLHLRAAWRQALSGTVGGDSRIRSVAPTADRHPARAMGSRGLERSDGRRRLTAESRALAGDTLPSTVAEDEHVDVPGN